MIHVHCAWKAFLHSHILHPSIACHSIISTYFYSGWSKYVFNSVTRVFTDRITWLVSGLLYELEVQLIAEDLLVQAL